MGIDLLKLLKDRRELKKKAMDINKNTKLIAYNAEFNWAGERFSISICKNNLGVAIGSNDCCKCSNYVKPFMHDDTLEFVRCKDIQLNKFRGIDVTPEEFKQLLDQITVRGAFERFYNNRKKRALDFLIDREKELKKEKGIAN